MNASCYTSILMVGRETGTIRTILVDDERLACDELGYLLKDFPEIEVIGLAHNGLDAVEVIEEQEPDLVFLDVQMPGLNGLGVIRKLKEKGMPLPHFVLATAYDHYAVDAFRHEATDYLLKPIDIRKLKVYLDSITIIIFITLKSTHTIPFSKEFDKERVMHMADALISPTVGGAMWITSASLIWYSSRKINDDFIILFDPVYQIYKGLMDGTGSSVLIGQ